MYARIALAFLALVALFSWGQAVAQEEAASPEEVTTGEVRIKMNTQFAKLRLDGEEWENHEFVDNGRTLVIYGVDRTVEHTVELTPVDPGYEGATLKIVPEDWKLVRVKRRVKVWRAEKKIRFAKVGEGAKSKATGEENKAKKRGK